MNLVTFNDPFKVHMPAMLKKLAVDTPDHYEGLRLEPLLKAPLFLYGFTKYASAPKLGEMPWVHDGRQVLLPFPAFRIGSNKSGSDTELRYLVTRHKGHVCMFVYMDAAVKSRTTFIDVISIDDSKLNDMPGESALYDTDHQKFIELPARLQESQYASRHKMLLLMLTLCAEVGTPGNFLAKVTPPAKGRSVEWLQAREHFTVLHRSHPANRVEAGAVVHAATQDVNLQRVAHARRAHTRLLSSAKFKHKQGLRVPVRSSWVGPKEWQDAASKQVYKLIERST